LEQSRRNACLIGLDLEIVVSVSALLKKTAQNLSRTFYYFLVEKGVSSYDNPSAMAAIGEDAFSELLKIY
jgi:hypothetical protein